MDDSNVNPNPTPDAQPTPSVPPETPVSAPLPPAQVPKKSLKWLIIGVIVLLLIVIGLLVVLLTHKAVAPAPQTAVQKTAPADTTKDIGTRPTEKVIARVPSKQTGITILIYQPRTTSTNLTIDFALQNSCSTKCEKVFTSLDQAFGFGTQYPQAVTYLLDAKTGAKYAPVTETDGGIQTCPTTSGYLAAKAQLNCYYAFTGVPAGSTVSFLSGSFRADGILTP